MFPFFALITLLWGAQLDPSLVPHPAPKPALPKVDQKACPGEGCQFGAWTARKPVALYSGWKTGRTVVARVTAGEKVTAITGVFITYEPLEIEITAPITDYDLKPGDHVFGYMPLGEGVFNAWFNGKWLENFDGSGVSAPDGEGCRRNCNARLLKQGKFEWWVQLRTKSGVVGWTNETDKFDGKDALASFHRPTSFVRERRNE